MDDVLVIGFADPFAEDAESIRRTAGDSLDRLEGILREIAAEDAAVVRGEDIDQIGLAPEGDELRFEPGAAFAQRFLGIKMRADAAQMAADDLQYFGSDVINGVVRIVKADESDEFPGGKDRKHGDAVDALRMQDVILCGHSILDRFQIPEADGFSASERVIPERDEGGGDKLQVFDLRGDSILTPFVVVPVIALFLFVNAENVGTIRARDLPDVSQKGGNAGIVGGAVGNLVQGQQLGEYHLHVSLSQKALRCIARRCQGNGLFPSEVYRTFCLLDFFYIIA